MSSNEEPPELSSPVCYADEADDAYMGYVPSAELIGQLNRVLECSRSIGRVAIQSSGYVERNSEIDILFRRIRKSEAEFCGALQLLIAALGGQPSRHSDVIYRQAIALGNSCERAMRLVEGRFANVRLLRDLLPRIRGEQLYYRISGIVDVYETPLTDVKGANLGGNTDEA